MKSVSEIKAFDQNSKNMLFSKVILYLDTCLKTVEFFKYFVSPRKAVNDRNGNFTETQKQKLAL